MEIWKHLQDTVKISDVLTINQNGEVSAIIWMRMVHIKYPIFQSCIRWSCDSCRYKKIIRLKAMGSWMVTDFLIMDGKQFYLMEHQKFHDQANKVILDSYAES